MNTFDKPEWEIPLLELLAQKHKELHEDWINRKNDFASGWSLSPWTFAFKKTLKEIAGDTFECRSSIEPSGEFLWDVSWFKNNEVLPEMVCEIEWGGAAAALNDFMKLLATTSNYAIMIFDSEEKNHIKSEDDFMKWIEQMVKLIPNDSPRRFIFIYTAATGAKDGPRIRAKSFVGREKVFEDTFGKITF